MTIKLPEPLHSTSIKEFEHIPSDDCFYKIAIPMRREYRRYGLKLYTSEQVKEILEQCGALVIKHLPAIEKDLTANEILKITASADAN